MAGALGFDAPGRPLLEALMEGWEVAPDRRTTLAAVMGHALDFGTWRSLAGGGLTDDQVVAVLVGLVVRVADGSITG